MDECDLIPEGIPQGMITALRGLACMLRLWAGERMRAAIVAVRILDRYFSIRRGAAEGEGRAREKDRVLKVN